MGTGIWANFHWESGIWVTGTGIWSLEMGITDRKTIELGLGFLEFGKAIGWEMGFGQNLGWENGIYTPPSGPSPQPHSQGFSPTSQFQKGKALGTRLHSPPKSD